MARGGSRLSVIVGIVALLCFGAIMYLSYELGRYQAGYSIMDVRRRATERLETIATQGREIEDLERQIAILETAREVDRETYAQVEANLEELEQKIQAQERELAFYQGIVSPEEGDSGLRVQSFSIEPGDTEQAFFIRLVLVQAIVHSQRVTGSVKLRVSGRGQDGERVELDLPALGVADGAAMARYAFRYFQTLGFEVTLPYGFRPESVDVEVEPEQPDGPTVVESYAWLP